MNIFNRQFFYGKKYTPKNAFFCPKPVPLQCLTKKGVYARFYKKKLNQTMQSNIPKYTKRQQHFIWRGGYEMDG
jgi:hypothetical protein